MIFFYMQTCVFVENKNNENKRTKNEIYDKREDIRHQYKGQPRYWRVNELFFLSLSLSLDSKKEH